jgi:hypothetical protein
MSDNLYLVIIEQTGHVYLNYVKKLRPCKVILFTIKPQDENYNYFNRVLENGSFLNALVYFLHKKQIKCWHETCQHCGKDRVVFDDLKDYIKVKNYATELWKEMYNHAY